VAVAWIALLVLAVARPQDDRDTDPAKLPGDAEKPYRLGRFDEAAKELRSQFASAPSDKLRIGLLQVLVRARKHEELSREADAAAAGTRDEGTRAFAWWAKGHAQWRLGDREAARSSFDAALKLADAKGPNSYPAVRRSVTQSSALMTWKRTETKHFEVWTPPDSALDPEARGRALEAAYERITAVVGPGPASRIEAWFFNDQRQADAALGVPLNFAAPRDAAFYALADAPGAHEVAHVIGFWASAAKGRERPACALLVEGLAVALCGEPLWEQRVVDVPRKLARERRLRPLAELAAATGGDSEFSAVAGSVVKWLLDRHGRETFAKLWVEFHESADPWKSVLGATLDALDPGWRKGVGE
jgi:tetratricopeptide (TPR) repeat protein